MSNQTLFFTVILSALVVVGAVFLASGRDLPFLKPAYQREVATMLRDPESAQFRNVRQTARGKVFCGEVTGRNAFGGMGDWTSFMAYRRASGGWGVPPQGVRNPWGYKGVRQHPCSA